jgi:predicted NBD/HSP70 family sugar kinase
MVRKVDSQVMQQANRAMVLNLVRSGATLSRADIARATGLSRATVSAIVERLMLERLVTEEGPRVTRSVGRRPLRLAFNAGARLTIGIAVDIRRVSVALVDLNGQVSTVYKEAILPGASPAEVMDEAARLARRASADATPGSIIGAGVAVPGTVEWPGGVNAFSPNFGWRDVPVKAMIEERLGCCVQVDNEVRVAALAEHRLGSARGARHVVFLDAGFGLGGALLIDGALYRGRHGAAGEIGHNTIDLDGPPCSCGKRGCLEVFASTNGLVARALAAICDGKQSSLAGRSADGLSFDTLVEEAARGDQLASSLLEDAAVRLGLAVADAINNWDPDLVVVSGPVALQPAHLFDAILAAKQRFLLDPSHAQVPVVRASAGVHAKIVGAALLVIAPYLAAPISTGPAGT